MTPQDARKAPLPGSPLMMLCGLISHLRRVRIAVDIPLPQLLAEYEEQSGRHCRLLADHDLNTAARRPVRDGRYVDLRWVVLHFIEESSRHNGHLDVRELVDGRTGT